jgi:hypothetical protein
MKRKTRFNTIQKHSGSFMSELNDKNLSQDKKTLEQLTSVEHPDEQTKTQIRITQERVTGGEKFARTD